MLYNTKARHNARHAPGALSRTLSCTLNVGAAGDAGRYVSSLC
jgi:hypothetical protein